MDYHGLPTINLYLKKFNYQYDLEAADYLFLPYIYYSRPMSLCTLAINPTTDYSQQFNDDKKDFDLLVLG